MNIKVIGNYCGFIPAEFDLIDGSDSFLVHVASFQNPTLLIDKVARIHGSFSPEQAEKFFKGPGGPDPNPVDILARGEVKFKDVSLRYSEFWFGEYSGKRSGVLSSLSPIKPY